MARRSLSHGQGASSSLEDAGKRVLFLQEVEGAEENITDEVMRNTKEASQAGMRQSKAKGQWAVKEGATAVVTNVLV